MCTMSWFKTDDGYELFFNRDEINTRRRAEVPVIYREKNVAIVSPTDADAGGTWISVNHFGITLCLLNHYEKEQMIHHTDWMSRGNIIRRLAIYSSLSDIEINFLLLELTQYKPFRLYVLDQFGKSIFFTWDGQIMTKEYDLVKPRSSSSYKPEQVRSARKQLFLDKQLNSSTDRKAYLDFHKSHEPSRSAYSVCMHRDNASSVSLSHIVVDAQAVAFSYADGSPCEEPLSAPLEMKRVNVPATNAA